MAELNDAPKRDRSISRGSHLPDADKRVRNTNSKSTKIKNWDVDNLYPNRMERLKAASGITGRCIHTYAKFMRGQGFNDITFYKAKINSKGWTVDQLIRRLSAEYGLYLGYAIHVNYDATFKISEVRFIKLKDCRHKIYDENGYVSKIGHYTDWECEQYAKIQHEKIKFYDVYNPNPDVIAAQIEKSGGIDNYLGQILFRSDLIDEYPLCSFDSVREDVITDAGIKTFRRTTVEDGFMGAHMVNYPYEFEDEEELQQEKRNWKNVQGVRNSQKFILMQGQGKEDKDKISITKIESLANDKMFEATTSTVKDSIIENYGIPKVLLGINVPGQLGTAQQIVDAYDFYNSITIDERNMFEEDFKEIFSNFTTPINPSGDYSIKTLSFKSNSGEIASDVTKMGVIQPK